MRRRAPRLPSTSANRRMTNLADRTTLEEPEHGGINDDDGGRTTDSLESQQP